MCCLFASSCPLTPVVSKASSGVMEVMRVYGYDSLVDMVKVPVLMHFSLAMHWSAYFQNITIYFLNVFLLLSLLFFTFVFTAKATETLE